MMLPDISSPLIGSLLKTPIRPMLCEPGGWGYLVYVQYRCLEKRECAEPITWCGAQSR